jgi:hypothetical protein
MEKGNALLLMLVAIPVFIGAAGLALDYSRGVWVRTKLQRAADAGALAGASYLPNRTVADGKAGSIIVTNYGEPETKTLSANAYSYTVQLSEVVPTFFMNIFGHDSMDVGVSATAISHRAVGELAGSGFPSAVINPNLNNDPSDDFIPDNFGRPYVINYGPNNTMVQDWANGSQPCPPDASGGNSNGWKAWLGLCSDGTLGNAGAADIKYDIINGWPGSMNIGDVIPMRNGNITGPPEQGRQELLGDDPLPWGDFSLRINGNSNRIVYVPVVHLIHVNRLDSFTAGDYYSGADWDRDNVVVDGFAPFFLLTDTEEDAYAEAMGLDTKHSGWMIGLFVPGVVTENYAPAGPNGIPDMGLYQPPRLVD